jgi:isopentenyldiphosphate isomerase
MTGSHLAQDPDEPFDVVNADGKPLGYAKARADIHRDGDWHRAVHIWIYGIRNGGRFLLFQRRGKHKDTWPGRLDATVGGHFRAGETLSDTLREVDEEIGIPAEANKLHFAGVRVCSSEKEKGIVDRELQEVYLWRDDRPLTDFTPNPHELDGLVRIPLAMLLDFGAGQRKSLESVYLEAGSSRIEPVRLARQDFIPSIDRYSYRVAIAASLALDGHSHIAI